MQGLYSACPVNSAPTEKDGLLQILNVLWVQSFQHRRGKQGTSCVPPRDIMSPAARGVGAYGTGLFVLKKRLDPFNRICSSKVFVAWLYSTCLGTNCICFKMFLGDSSSLTHLKGLISFTSSFLMRGTMFIHWDFSSSSCQRLLLVLPRLLQCFKLACVELSRPGWFQCACIS